MSGHRYRQRRSGVPAEVGMADLIDVAVKVMRTRARRLLAFTGQRAVPVFELLIVNDELADLAACLSDRCRNRDATGRELDP
jgi:hypothetical protein